ncbi:Uncharacterized protein FKW44_005841 [Caligus rogercresseyi]|uniref:Uncharacterized protein n=1 Tax=Caligus rogercresseyi TaxID=217165 RepID=A0A7T8QSB1_CALRO|nr:Uncharacterized protein FKW44_005841 [Caligus rogercresseyi]
MSSEQDDRASILDALRVGCALKEIIEFLKLPITTVYRMEQEFNEFNGNATPLKKTQDWFRSKKRTPKFLHELQERINAKPCPRRST